MPTFLSFRPSWPAILVALPLTVMLAALPQQADAAPAGHMVAELSPRTSVDWSRGLLIARGAASADLRAPSPEIARVAAERKAREQARAHLVEAAKTMTIAGRLLSAHIDERPEKAEALRRAAASAAVDLEVEYASDGSTVVVAALPLEVLRSLIHSAPEAAQGAKPPGATALIIDARGVMTAPALGVLVEIGKERYAAPTVFYSTRAAAEADPRVGKQPAWVRATAKTRGEGGATLVLGEAPGSDRGKARSSLEAARQAAKAGALVVIVIGKTS